MSDSRVTLKVTGKDKFSPVVRDFQAALWCCAYEQAHDNESGQR